MGSDRERGCLRCNALLSARARSGLCAYCASLGAPMPQPTPPSKRPRMVIAIAGVIVVGIAGAIAFRVFSASDSLTFARPAPIPPAVEPEVEPEPEPAAAAPLEPALVAESAEMAEAPGPDLSLPETLDRDRVLRRLRRIDPSSCPGDFAITFTVQVRPDGTVTAPTMGPLRTHNADLSCVQGLFRSLRFGKSQRGLTVRHQLRGGSFK